MAELHVEKKERNMLPFILAAVALLALLAWWFMGRGDGDDTAGLAMNDSTSVMADSAAGVMNDDTTGMGAMPAAVQQFHQYASDESARTASGAHEYSANGLRRLSDAIEAVARDRNTTMDLQPRLMEMRTRADSIQQNATASNHSLQVREASLLAANLIRDAHTDASAASTAATSVQQAAEAIDAQRPLLDQTSQVQQFFVRSASALRDLYARAN